MMRCAQGEILAFIFCAIVESWQMKRGHRVVDLQRSACTLWHRQANGLLAMLSLLHGALQTRLRNTQAVMSVSSPCGGAVAV